MAAGYAASGLALGTSPWATGHLRVGRLTGFTVADSPRARPCRGRVQRDVGWLAARCLAARRAHGQPAALRPNAAQPRLQRSSARRRPGHRSLIAAASAPSTERRFTRDDSPASMCTADGATPSSFGQEAHECLVRGAVHGRRSDPDAQRSVRTDALDGVAPAARRQPDGETDRHATLPLAEDGAADAHDGRALLDRHLEVVAHAHRQAGAQRRGARARSRAESSARRRKVGRASSARSTSRPTVMRPASSRPRRDASSSMQASSSDGAKPAFAGSPSTLTWR